MKDIRKQFEAVAWTEKEREELTARLGRSVPRKSVPKSHWTCGKLAACLAATLLFTACAAAVLGSGLGAHFQAGGPGAEETLQAALTPIHRSLTYEGWTVSLTECVGDDTQAYFWLEVEAPEGQVLKNSRTFEGFVEFRFSGEAEGFAGHSIYALEDKNPDDEKIQYCLNGYVLPDDSLQDLKGAKLDVIVSIEDICWSEAAQSYHRGEQTAAISDHQWVFEHVELSYPDQTIRLRPDLVVPYAGGETVLTNVEISPLRTWVRVEGGSCWNHPHSTGNGEWECWEKLEVSLVMQDGTELSPPEMGSAGSGCRGSERAVSAGCLAPEELSYVEWRFQYMDNSTEVPPVIIDPAQVAFVRVCGVEIPVSPEKTDARALGL